MLFVLGGNGTHAGADAIHNEVIKPLKIYILGVLILFAMSCSIMVIKGLTLVRKSSNNLQ